MFISFIVLFIIALIVLAVAKWIVPKQTRPTYGGEPEDSPARKWTAVGGIAVAGVAIICLIFSSFTTVGTKNLGVLTTFGRPTGSIDNGIHWKAPWESVTELSDRVQTDTYASDPGGKQQQGAVANCVNVRVARQATACVNVSIRWQIRQDGVDYLFRNYKDNEAIQDNLVLRDLQTAMNETLASYDPLGIDTNGNNTNKALSAVSGPSLSADVLKQMQNEIGTWIDVQTVNIPLLQFDGTTQDKINQLIQQIAATRVAQQALLTSQAQAAANQALAASVAQDPNVLSDKCLNILKEAIDKGQQYPAGGSGCFAGSTAGVVVGAK